MGAVPSRTVPFSRTTKDLLAAPKVLRTLADLYDNTLCFLLLHMVNGNWSVASLVLTFVITAVNSLTNLAFITFFHIRHHLKISGRESISRIRFVYNAALVALLASGARVIRCSMHVRRHVYPASVACSCAAPPNEGKSNGSHTRY